MTSRGIVFYLAIRKHNGTDAGLFCTLIKQPTVGVNVAVTVSLEEHLDRQDYVPPRM